MRAKTMAAWLVPCASTSRSSPPQQRTRTRPADPTATGNTSSCSSTPIFHGSPHAAALVSEWHQQASGCKAAQQLTAVGCWIVHISRISPSRPSVGLGSMPHTALSASGSPRAVAVSGTQQSTELVAAQQLAAWWHEWSVACSQQIRGRWGCRWPGRLSVFAP